VLNLKHVQRTEDGKLDALKDLSKLGWEIGRRWLSDLSRSRKGQEPTLQMVVIVDLDQAGMSNLVSLFLVSVSLIARLTDSIVVGNGTAALLHGFAQKPLSWNGRSE
jgi:hypothetical protein